MLELGVLAIPGTVYHSQVLVHYQTRVGFSGPGVLTEVRLAQRPFSAITAVPERALSQSSVPHTVLTFYGSRAGVSRLDQDTLRIGYRFSGDYDQNGEVNGADLSPIAAHFGKSNAPSAFATDSIESVVDGDANGLINASDIARIGLNFQRKFGGYEVMRQRTFGAPYPKEFRGASGLDPWQMIAADAPLHGQLGQQRLWFELQVSDDMHGWVIWAEARTDTGATDEATQMTVVGGLDSLTPKSHELAYQPHTELLRWYHSCFGDYDQNGEVNSADLWGIAAWSLEPVGTDVGRAIWHSDGFEDGIIDGWDAIVVGMRWQTHTTGCYVYTTSDSELVPSLAAVSEQLEPVGQVAFEDSSIAPWSQPYINMPRRLFEMNIELPTGSYVWVRPIVAGAPGPRSEVLQVE